MEKSINLVKLLDNINDVTLIDNGEVCDFNRMIIIIDKVTGDHTVSVERGEKFKCHEDLSWNDTDDIVEININYEEE